jgi:hypothetical protein
LYIALHIEPGRASKPAGRFIRLLNGESAWDGLRVFLVNGLPGRKTLVVFTRQYHRAYFGAVPAGRALGCIKVARSFSKRDLEIALDPGKVFNFSARDQVDVQMPADLDQFGRDDSHGAVIGGKGLVQFTHDAADGGRLLNKVNEIPGVCKVKGRLHACDAPTNDQD